jgi:glycerol kinase
MIEKECVVALDQGSSSSRALMIDGKGKVLRRAQFPLRMLRPKPGWIEHDPRAIWATQRRALESLIEAAKRPPSALAIACQRSTMIFWDAKTGQAVGPAMSWQDGRAASFAAALGDLAERTHAKTGLYLTPYYSAPKIAWAFANLPEVRRVLDAGRLRVGPVGTFLVWKLTGGEVFACDPTLAQRTLLFDIEKLDWDEELLRTFGVPREALPEIRPSRADWGEWRFKSLRVPIRAVVGDQQAAALGLGAGREGEAALNYGTGAFLILNTGKRRPKIPGILSSVTCAEDGSLAYAAEGTVHAAATSFDWLRENLGLLKDTVEADKLWSRSASNGRRVWCLPAIGGLGAPYWDYKTRTAFFGLDSQTRREDLVRAVGEGLAFLVADIARSIRGAGFELRGASASGGLSRMKALVQFQADLLGVPIGLSREHEVTALGAARLAGLPLSAPKTAATLPPKLSALDSFKLQEQWKKLVGSLKTLSEDIPA